MTPEELYDELHKELVTIQAKLRAVEQVAESKIPASPDRHCLCHEIVESWDAVERAKELLARAYRK